MPTDDRVLDALISSARAQERSSKAVEALTAEVRVSNEKASTMCRIGDDYLARARLRETRQEAWAVRFWETGKPYLLALLGAGVAWLGLAAAGGSGDSRPAGQDEVQAPTPDPEATGPR